MPTDDSSLRLALQTRGAQPVARAYHRYVHVHTDDRSRASALLSYLDAGMRLLVGILAADLLGTGAELGGDARDLVERKLATPSLGDWSRALAWLATSLPEGEWTVPALAPQLREREGVRALLRDVIDERNRVFHRGWPGFDEAGARQFVAEFGERSKPFAEALRTLADTPIVSVRENVLDDDGRRRAQLLRFGGVVPSRIGDVPGVNVDVQHHVPLLCGPEGRALRLDPLVIVDECQGELLLRTLVCVDGTVWKYDPLDGGDAKGPLVDRTPKSPRSADYLLRAPSPARFRVDNAFSPEARERVVGRAYGEPIVFEGFRVREAVGHGATSTVYRAEWRRSTDPEEVALKVLNESVVADPSLLARLEREHHVLARLKHSNTVRVYAYLREPRPALVLEYVKGSDLLSYVRRRGKLEVNKAAELCMQVLDSLDEAHRLGVVHRDVKAANVLLDAASGHARLLDFGIARIDSAHTVTTLADVLGTLAYAAPEQKRESRVADQRADLYSVGKLFQFLVTAELGEHLDGLPPGAAAVVRRATQPLAEHRYATALEMKADLEERLGTPWSGTPIAVGEVLLRSIAVGELAGAEESIFTYDATALDTHERLALFVGGTAQASERLLEAVRALETDKRIALGHPRVLREAWNWPFVIVPSDDPLGSLEELLGRIDPPTHAAYESNEHQLEMWPSSELPFLNSLKELASNWIQCEVELDKFLQGLTLVVTPSMVACCALIATRLRHSGSDVPFKPGNLRTFSSLVSTTLDLLDRTADQPWWPSSGIESYSKALAGISYLLRLRNEFVHGDPNEFDDHRMHALRLETCGEGLTSLVAFAEEVARGFDWETQLRPAVVRDDSGAWHVIRSSNEYVPLTLGAARLPVSDEARAWLESLANSRGAGS
jgi:serine/threonine protein kinase